MVVLNIAIQKNNDTVGADFRKFFLWYFCIHRSVRESVASRRRPEDQEKENGNPEKYLQPRLERGSRFQCSRRNLAKGRCK